MVVDIYTFFTKPIGIITLAVIFVLWLLYTTYINPENKDKSFFRVIRTLISSFGRPAITMAGVLATIYFLVRFVKWAWSG